MRSRGCVIGGAAVVAALGAAAAQPAIRIEAFAVPKGTHPHDVAPGPAGVVWYAAQRQGALRILDPATGQVRQVRLGEDSAPHGVIAGPDGAAWITDSALNAIVRVDPETLAVTRFPLPDDRGHANLNTGVFDRVYRTR